MVQNRKPNRLKGYDYSQDNLYFITSCVENRICFFGEIVSVDVGTGRDLSLHGEMMDGKMILNEYGKIAERQWQWLGEQYPYIVLHEFVVMPNHIHGIIEINRGIVGTCRNVRSGRDLSIQQSPMKIKSLSELMGAFKTTSSKQIHLLECKDRSRPVPTFQWQRSFYDHIIRDEKSYETIANYILSNPSKWEQDKFYTL
jgi:putative transposase